MDALDLSVGEKKSRRKTQIPQRRQNPPEQLLVDPAVDDVTDDYSKSNAELDNEELTDFMKSPHPAEGDKFNHLPIGDNVLFSNAKNDLHLEQTPPCPVLDDSNINASAIDSVIQNRVHSLSNPTNFNGANKELVLNTSIKKFPTNSSLKDYCERMTKRNFRTNFGSKAKEDVQPMDTPGIPERTKKQNRWAFNVWREWARKRNFTVVDNSCGLNGDYGEVPLDVGKASELQLDHWLSKFVQEVRRKDGNPYPPHTLMQIVMGIQRYLRQQAGRPSICILDRSNPTYSSFRAVLDNRIKELTNKGVASSLKNGRKSNSHIPAANKLSAANLLPHYPEETDLWESGVIGFDTALRLLNAVFFHNTVSFGIRTIDDHWNLKMCHFELGICGDQTYVEFVPSKDPMYVNRGLTQDKRVYSDSKNSRCAVNIFQKYLSLVPSDGAFYRHPQEPTLVDRSIRFSDQWIGKNRLRAMIKHIFDTTRLDGTTRYHQHGQINWPTATTMHSLSTSAAHTLAPKQLPMGNNIYDRLAQAMLHLSKAAKSSPFPTQFSEKRVDDATPVGTSPAMSSSPRLSDNEGSKTPDVLPRMTREGGNVDQHLEKDEIRPKRMRGNNDQPQNHIELSRPALTTGNITENVLEISVPKMITTVVITKGVSCVTVDLD